MTKGQFGIGIAFISTLILHVPALGTAGASPRGWALDGEKVFVHMPSIDTAGVWSIAQDRQGFLWLGTDNGLLRWDGYRLRNYAQDPGTAGALPDIDVRNLLIDERGQLWVGTYAGGLSRFDPDRDGFTSLPVGPGGTRDGNISALISDGTDGLWIGTGKGLDHLSGPTGQVDPPGPLLPEVPITALLLDRQGTLWAGTRTGLLRRARRDDRFVRVALPAADGAAPGVSALLEDHVGRIWIGTTLHGAFVQEPGQDAPRQLQESAASARPMSDTITAMREIDAGTVWLGTDNSGIVRVDTVGWKTWRERHDDARPSSLASNEINSLFLDRSGLVWVGSTAALSRNDPQQHLIQTFFGGSGSMRLLSKPSVPSLLTLPDGRVWAGLGEGGVDIIDPVAGRVGQLRPDPGQPDHALPKSKVDSMTRAADGSIYLGTAAGLYRASADGRRVARLAVPTDESRMGVRCVLFAGNRLWLGGFDGLWELKLAPTGAPIPVRHFERELGDARIVSVTAGRDASLWIGTHAGLARLDLATESVTRMPIDPKDKAALPGGFVSSVLTDRSGRLWVATYGRGIQVERGRAADGRPLFRRLTQFDGLPQNSVDTLLMDSGGNIWVSTDDGLARIEPETLLIHSYRVAQGVGFAGFWTGAGTVTPAGDLLFGGLNGMIALHPDHDAREESVAPMAITEVHVGSHAVAAATTLSARGLEVAPSDHSIGVEFAALDFTDPEHRRYAYRLQGFDTDWVETPVSRRLAAYTNLPPGDYTLQLRSATADGQWATPLQVPIHVTAAWFQHGAVRALGLLLALALVVGLVQLRTLMLRRRQGELERLVAERTAELRRSQEQLEQLAYFDALTGLPNRRMFNEHLRRLIATQHRGQGGFALLLIDLDGFKPVNDTLGHAVGDALLASIAAQLRTLVRGTDLAARLGGDEFAVLLSQTTDLVSIESTCARIVTKLGEPLVVLGHSVKVGASVGIVPCPNGGATADELYRAADSALYEAKQAGRSTWRWGRAESYTFTEA
jgi:diguanylate cyclase (GGDEF)-like protein